MKLMPARGLGLAASASLLLLISATLTAGQAQGADGATGATTGTESLQARIDRALAAGPRDISADATVADLDATGKMTVLRQGSNGWVCMPGTLEPGGLPPMCADKVAMQWNMDFMHHKEKPTTTVPGIEYMLEGATQRSDSDPYDKTDPPIRIGPHWMILWPFDPQTSGLPTSHRDRGAYIMWAGTPWAHVHVMGDPQG
jgi:hypothetical protein